MNIHKGLETEAINQNFLAENVKVKDLKFCAFSLCVALFNVCL